MCKIQHKITRNMKKSGSMITQKEQNNNSRNRYEEDIDGWVPVADACNSSYSGGRKQEDRGSKPVRANSSQEPISKTPSQKKQW
jgi:hypothetical protein